MYWSLVHALKSWLAFSPESLVYINNLFWFVIAYWFSVAISVCFVFFYHGVGWIPLKTRQISFHTIFIFFLEAYINIYSPSRCTITTVSMPLESVKRWETQTFYVPKQSRELRGSAAAEGIRGEISHATKHEHPAFLSTSPTPSRTN